MVEMIEPYEGKIFDAACGSGGNVCAVIEILESHGGDKRTSLSMDKSAMMMVLRLCKMNNHDLSFDVRLGDSAERVPGLGLYHSKPSV
jgi:type I restriction enzyme M protein